MKMIKLLPNLFRIKATISLLSNVRFNTEIPNGINIKELNLQNDPKKDEFPKQVKKYKMHGI
jgi:hypothetical protein